MPLYPGASSQVPIFAWVSDRRRICCFGNESVLACSSARSRNVDECLIAFYLYHEPQRLQRLGSNISLTLRSTMITSCPLARLRTDDYSVVHSYIYNQHLQYRLDKTPPDRLQIPKLPPNPLPHLTQTPTATPDNHLARTRRSRKIHPCTGRRNLMRSGGHLEPFLACDGAEDEK